ncbi:hypothetical protein V6N12_012371 [Hibiscus sabdariffa]|uniref:Uncharacterized protein n=1 Tax=Hibiscus sabdariffa TaxID=183260 RepID=A0ABR2CI02_9ROSI
MAKTNKYTSINFNHVIEKNLISPSSGSHKNHQPHSSFSSYSSASNVKTHGRMLVLTLPDQPPSSDQISLRPGSGISITGPEKKKKEGVFVSGVKSDRFVPPHLRPGFAGKEEKPEPKVLRGRETGVKHFVPSDPAEIALVLLDELF